MDSEVPQQSARVCWSLRVPCVGNTDDRHTATAGQTGQTTKHRLSSLLVIYVLPSLGAIQYIALNPNYDLNSIPMYYYLSSLPCHQPRRRCS